MKNIFHSRKGKLAIIALALITCLCICLCACTHTPSPNEVELSADISIDSQIKNVIVIIGDGMGFNHIANTKLKYGFDALHFEQDYVCPVVTTPLFSDVTDSAAAGTAMATGTKVSKGSIGQTNKGENLRNIMEIAKSHSKKTGIITSDYLFGATPATFSSHAYDRNNKADIIKSQASTSAVDLLVGQRDSDNLYATTYNQNFVNNGYSVVSTDTGLFSQPSSQKVVATLDSLRSKYNDTLSGQLDFSAIVEYALSYLDNQNGFCLMIEHAHIDKCSHSKDLNGAMCEMRAMIDTINLIYSFIADRNDTAVIITADHETGGLKLAENADSLTDALYTTKSHTGTTVPLFTKNITLTNFDETVDNTLIFAICKRIVER